jgi:hypothetical protein
MREIVDKFPNSDVYKFVTFAGLFQDHSHTDNPVNGDDGVLRIEATSVNDGSFMLLYFSGTKVTIWKPTPQLAPAFDFNEERAMMACLDLVFGFVESLQRGVQCYH